MRALVLLAAPLLLSGCGLLPGFQESGSISTGPEGFEICRTTRGVEECLAQPIDEDLGEDGYVLTCQDVDAATCQDVAERAAADVRPPREVRWIVVRPDSYDVCWVEPTGDGCSGGNRQRSGPRTTLPPRSELEDVLVCEGVGRDACEEAAVDALSEVLASEGIEIRTLESVIVRSDGSWEVCWGAGCQGAEPAEGVMESPPA